MARHQSRENTKELILQAAFSFMASPRFIELSLSEIARVVGVTKTAIFRHYTNKDDLLSAMKNRFFDDIAACLSDIHNTTSQFQQIVIEATVFFVKHPEHLGFLAHSLALSPLFEQIMVTELLKRGVAFITDIYDILPGNNGVVKPKSADTHDKMIYVLITLLFGILRLQKSGRFATHGTDVPEKEVQQFAEAITGFLFSGWNALSPISEARMNELDALCAIDPAQIPPENKFFLALSAVIRKYGFPGITVTRIAAEMGMAKSSLYSYFSNKNEMIFQLIQNELDYLRTCIQKHCSCTDSLSESVYLHLTTEMNYFSLRPSIFPVINWMRTNGSLNNPEAIQFGKNNLYKKQPVFPSLPLEELQIGVDQPLIYEWISSLPIPFLLDAQLDTGRRDKKTEKIRTLYSCLCNGVEK